MKARSNVLPSRNDYQLNLHTQNIMLARGRDTLRSEKIVWTAVNMKLQNTRIKSRVDNKSIPYQRGARAIARQVNRETEGKAEMTADKAQRIIDAWYARYSNVRKYVDWCKDGVRNPPHWIENPYGRRRRFYLSPDESVMAAQEREAVNFPIQSVVADTLSVALYNLWRYRQLHPECGYRILLAIHDAVMLEVPVSQLEHVVDFVLPACMVHGAPVPKLGFSFDIDPEVMLRWGEKAEKSELKKVGVPEKYW